MRNKHIILGYHSIGGSCDEVGSEKYSISLTSFSEQMEYLTLLRSSRVSGLNEFNKINVSITFDDGLLDNYLNAYPVLKSFGLNAYFFIIASFVGKKNYMNWDQIKELHKNGMLIGSHGMTHRILSNLTEKEIEYELRESKNILEDNLKEKVEYLSIPRGFSNQNIIDKARECGYSLVFTSQRYINNDFQKGRVFVRKGWNLSYFKQIITKGFPFKDRIDYLMRNIVKRLLGATAYDGIRSQLLGKKGFSNG